MLFRSFGLFPSHDILQEYNNLIADGYSQRKACEILGVARSTMQDALKREVKVLPESITKSPTKPKVLFYDIETLPNISAHFGNWNENLSHKQRIQESCLLSHSWCWGNDGEIHGSVLIPTEAINHDDERLVLELWSLLDNADVVIGHNISRYDNKKANAYFIKYGLPPVSGSPLLNQSPNIFSNFITHSMSTLEPSGYV